MMRFLSISIPGNVDGFEPVAIMVFADFISTFSFSLFEMEIVVASLKVACPVKTVILFFFIRYVMPSTAILHEVQRLYGVSDRLDLLAEQHPLVSEALLAISGSVRNTATLLEVLVATKMAPLSGLDPADA